jgi:CubicO group peptidase (beta-lactamase class C family)
VTGAYHLRRIERFVPGWMAARQVPGLALAVVKDGQVVLARGFGRREVDKNDLVDEDTLFAIASNTKAFTATALGILVQENKLAWDDPVVDHLPSFRLYDPTVTRLITVRDLLCHRSGLPTWGGDLIGYGSCYSRDEIMAKIRHIRPAYSFRSGYGYCNMMFLVAGQLIPAVTGMSWDDLIKTRFLDPLGMSRSKTSVQDLETEENVAIPHEFDEGRPHPVPYRDRSGMAPAGGINSTAGEMARWLLFQLNQGQVDGQQLVDSAIIKETSNPHTPIPIPPAGNKLFPSRHFWFYGLGWRLMDYQGRLVVEHTGGLDGMISRVTLLPEENLGVVVLTNALPNSLPLALSYSIVDAYLYAPERDWDQVGREQDREEAAGREKKAEQMSQSRIPDTHPSLPLAAYAGDYLSSLYGRATVSEENGGLSLRLLGHPGILGQLEHWHHDTFLCRWSDPIFDRSLVPFITDGQGQVEEFRLKVREDWIDPLEYRFSRR